MLRSCRKLVGIVIVLAILGAAGWLAVELSPYSPRSQARELTDEIYRRRGETETALKRHCPTGIDFHAWLESLPEDGSTWQGLVDHAIIAEGRLDGDPVVRFRGRQIGNW